MDSFLTDLYSFKICLSREDWRTWTISRALGFKVNTYYKDLRKGGDQHFPLANYVASRISSSCQILYVAYNEEQILNYGQSAEKSIVMPDWCSMC